MSDTWMGSLADQSDYQPVDDPWRKYDADQLPDVGPPAISPGPQISEGAPWANKAADVASRYPGHVVSGIASLPQRLMENSQYSLDTGTYDPSAPMEAATMLWGVNAPFVKPGQLGVMGGKLGASNEQLAALKEAETARAAGTPEQQIWQQHKWGWDAEGNPRFEILDRPSMLFQGEGKLGDLWHHPELFQKYPDMADIPASVGVRERPGPGTAAAYTAPTHGRVESLHIYKGDPEDFLSSAVHEASHAIQHREGLPIGNNPMSQEVLDRARQTFNVPPTKYPENAQLMETYARAGGEVDARNAQTRLEDFSEHDLPNLPPTWTQDRPTEQQWFTRQAPRAVTRPYGPPPTPPVMGEVLSEAQAAKPKMASIISPDLPSPSQINDIKAAAKSYGHGEWPPARSEVFSTAPEGYAATTDLVPQQSIKERLPGPLPGEALPLKGRAEPIVANTEAISDRIAERLDPWVQAQDPRLKFYHTGPVIQGLQKYGEGDPALFMRDWAGQGAATSPRTSTPPNLRNASFLQYERARGNPMTPERYAAEGNEPGYGMMGMHVNLSDAFARGTENAWKNPKPTTFRENWSGNLQDVTGDTHNIRSTLYEADRVAPGSLPAEWFTGPDAYHKYRNEGFQAIGPGDIVDTLGSKTVKGVQRQSEYLPMTAPWYRAAEKLGIHPAEGQSGGWFSYGGITGLQSPPKTIVNLLNDQIDATAKAANVSPEKIVNWWSRGKIPLAGLGGIGAMGEIARQDNYQGEE